jgi:hypothetical protein
MDLSNLTKEELKKLASNFSRLRVSEPLFGAEKEQTRLLLELSTPVRETNNQRFITRYYRIGDQEYSMTWFNDSDYTVDRSL